MTQWRGLLRRRVGASQIRRWWTYPRLQVHHGVVTGTTQVCKFMIIWQTINSCICGSAHNQIRPVGGFVNRLHSLVTFGD